MGVSVQVPLSRKEILVGGPQTRPAAGLCKQQRAAAWCLLSAGAGVIQDINVHHTV